VRVVIYVEGGGRQRRTLDHCRRGFGELFEKVVRGGHHPKVVACGDRRSTFDDFRNVSGDGSERFRVLLVDSEGPVPANVTPWSYLRARDGWNKPAGALEDQAHLMVQSMESWVLADREALTDYYKRGFLPGSLPTPRTVENILKRDVLRALRHASRHTQKGPYHKARHGFDLLARIDPAKLRGASVHARRLFEVLEARARM